MNQREDTDIYQNVNIHHIASEGRKIYDRIKEKYIAEKGKFLAIDIESSDVFLGDSNSEAVEVAKNKYPDHVFYVVRIGYSAAERLASMAL
ncbi:MAG: hypothetical protein A3C02_00565 [Candidatus Andersenbacteria bacterium RIFCSPHIGHO2_02_FULL_45_11]|uniref:DUF5678 domain-containing protein n=1 Tax=Candidatus Andersenbacteria bacterium RIFCSPHIGHO2_12_FULL_45_11 TaxID=1797281 RepID=A0A1G1X209_9BACT|nr:MAG: hypothetical protein A2805_02515 [Candidatus Andersenbacteria bacterium RIFCSPHIGHO2_01_FULL_46_36]OGY31893.1 MAG: hypothetical protein A3C02_00565 [Candidatus Andersenbacteria bacterium RIFCSPHIGHO2_02_FULL_45_11]OGY34038.1 MAG: hypothetical protein A3D99_02155 [Candidatus Andersenbacteria bacterium RIFCSPHIGHO2_12_FULL_45_11]